MAREHPGLAPRLFEALSQPFAVSAYEARRLQARALLTRIPGVDAHCVAVFESIEPHALWARAFLEQREACYRRHQRPLADRARADLARFDSLAVPPIADRLQLRREPAR